MRLTLIRLKRLIHRVDALQLSVQQKKPLLLVGVMPRSILQRWRVSLRWRPFFSPLSSRLEQLNFLLLLCKRSSSVVWSVTVMNIIIKLSPWGFFFFLCFYFINLGMFLIKVYECSLFYRLQVLLKGGVS